MWIWLHLWPISITCVKRKVNMSGKTQNNAVADTKRAEIEPQQNQNLNETQQYIMSVLTSLLEITEKMNIRCYMQGGTMLGAIRHKGFIPWDDDVDLGIMRPDYEVFLKEVEKLLPEHLELRTYWDETAHHYYFARIIDNRHLIKRMGSAEVRYENVWVDIFPLDGMPNRTLARKLHQAKLSWARLTYHLSSIEKVNAKRPGRPAMEKLVIKLALSLKFVFRMDTKKRLDKIDRLLKKYPVEGSDYIINFMGQTSFKFNEMIKKEIYSDGTMYPFEDIQMFGPTQYDAYLTSLYGDYMVPPKDADKNSHVSELVE